MIKWGIGRYDLCQEEDDDDNDDNNDNDDDDDVKVNMIYVHVMTEDEGLLAIVQY